MPLQGGPLIILLVLWALSRIAVLSSAILAPAVVAVLDLAFPVYSLPRSAARSSPGGIGALTLLLVGNALAHLDALGAASTAQLSNRVGVATLLMLISFVGGRIIQALPTIGLPKRGPKWPPPRALISSTGLLWRSPRSPWPPGAMTQTPRSRLGWSLLLGLR
jgi:uncharacterized protein involved in response to NO